MKRKLLSFAVLITLLLVPTVNRAQSIKDLFNKDNISKVVNAVTGHTETVDMTGTWRYTGSAIEFESENLLKKAGGTVAASAAEQKLDEQLAKVGIKEGQLSFTFKHFRQTQAERNILLRCRYPDAPPEVYEINPHECKSQLYHSADGSSVRSRQIAEANHFLIQ